MNIFINFKNYSSGIGQKKEELLDFLESLYTSHKMHDSFHLVVPSTEIAPICEKYSFNLWAQHADPIEEEQKTGWVTPLMVKEAGAIGVMLNHSEHRLPQQILEKTVQICRRENLKVMICCQSEKEAIIYSKLNPDFLAFEPPELIASKTESVISKSHIISSLIPLLPLTPLVVGAGIKTNADIKKSEELGAKGVLIASAIMEGKKEKIKKLLAHL